MQTCLPFSDSPLCCWQLPTQSQPQLPELTHSHVAAMSCLNLATHCYPLHIFATILQHSCRRTWPAMPLSCLVCTPCFAPPPRPVACRLSVLPVHVQNHLAANCLTHSSSLQSNLKLGFFDNCSGAGCWNKSFIFLTTPLLLGFVNTSHWNRVAVLCCERQAVVRRLPQSMPPQRVLPSLHTATKTPG